MRITWLGHACFMVEYEGYRVVIDPFCDVPGCRDTAVEADAVLCSHGHYDHAYIGGVALRERIPSTACAPGVLRWCIWAIWATC